MTAKSRRTNDTEKFYEFDAQRARLTNPCKLCIAPAHVRAFIDKLKREHDQRGEWLPHRSVSAFVKQQYDYELNWQGIKRHYAYDHPSHGMMHRRGIRKKGERDE